MARGLQSICFVFQPPQHGWRIKIRASQSWLTKWLIAGCWQRTDFPSFRSPTLLPSSILQRPNAKLKVDGLCLFTCEWFDLRLHRALSGSRFFHALYSKQRQCGWAPNVTEGHRPNCLPDKDCFQKLKHKIDVSTINIPNCAPVHSQCVPQTMSHISSIDA